MATMDEQHSDYSLDRPSSRLSRKAQGLVNRYHQARRSLAWSLHLAVRRPISLDFDRIVPGSIPVLVNNFNRLEALRTQLDWLLGLEGDLSIIIMDNASTYPPLIGFYRSLDIPNVQVLHLDFNSCGLAAKEVAARLPDSPRFVVTDPDLQPYPTTPRNAVLHLSDLLDRYPGYNHVGLSLEVNDLPDHSPLKASIVQHESRFWPPQAERLSDKVCVAPVDTTFAMYRSTSDVDANAPALRTCRPYTLKHVDWYRNPEDLSDEYLYYLKTSKPYATWAAELKRHIAEGA
jgi:hypothetical protein